MSFKIEKITGEVIRKDFAISIVLHEAALRDALDKAVKDSGSARSALITRMIRHCLTESGYLEHNQTVP